MKASRLRDCRMRLLLAVAIGLLCTSLAHAGDEREPASRRMAITVDDLPTQRGDLEKMRSITARLLEEIAEQEIPVVGFANEGKLHRLGQLEERTDLLRQWLDAGLELGNHTYSHNCDLSVPVEDYQEDVIRGETVLRRLMEERGMPLRYFRHPCLYTGPTAEYKRELDEFLESRRYTVAAVTVDNSEWLLGAVYSKAKQKGDTATVSRIREAYVPYMETTVEFFEDLSREFLGYELPQILLLHANELNADLLGDVIRMLKHRGYRFVTLEEALGDPAYSLPEAPSKRGLSWIHRWRKAAGLEFRREPDAPEFVVELFEGGYR